MSFDLPPELARCATWIDVLRHRAAATPDQVAYRFLADGETETEHLTYGQLDQRARSIAASLQARGAVGQRVILAHPPGLEFVAAFMGCIYAGAIAVPTFPPRSGANGQRLATRMTAILDDCTPTAITTTAATAERLGEFLRSDQSATLLATDTIDPAQAEAWTPPGIDGSALACLQYTSGTSGTPKGVMLTHAALLANSVQIAECFGSSRASVGLCWLPPQHDMGLIGGVLQPLFVGFPVVLMPPTAFLQRPSRWIQAISRYRATISGGPCFSYSLAARSISEAELAQLDLSAWEVAFSGAEPVRQSVLEQFAERFNPAGFSPSAYLPCYGLAEASLFVTGVRRRSGVRTTEGREGRSPHVGCGTPVAPATISIVDPVLGGPVPAGIVGEIWVRSASLASGYWGKSDKTQETFDARPAGSDLPYLRTGDLGFIDETGELFVTGRLKDLVIVNGVNHYPHEIEQSAEQAHPALQPDGAAAFAVDRADREGLALVMELRRTARDADPRSIIDAVRRQIGQMHGVEVDAVVLVRPGAVLRTPSGKIQRSACRAAYEAGELEPIHVYERAEGRADDTDTTIPADDPHGLVDAASVEAWLAEIFARLLNVTPQQIDPHQPLSTFGIASADAVGLAGEISIELNIDLPATALWDYPTLAALADFVSQELAATARSQAAGSRVFTEAA